MVILGGVHFPSHFRSHLPAHFFHISHFLASWTSHFWHIFGTIELTLDLESYIGHGRHKVRIKGTFGEIDTLNKVWSKRARSEVMKGPLKGASLILPRTRT